MKSLFVILSSDERGDEVYRTPATDALLAKLDKAGGQWSEYGGYESSTDVALALTRNTPLSAFTAVVGDVPLDKVEVDDFLSTMGADGIDCFY